MILPKPPDPVKRFLDFIAPTFDKRQADLVAPLFLGELLAHGRRTATSWFRAAGITDAFRPAYSALGAAGRRARDLGFRLLRGVLRPLLERQPGDRVGPGLLLHHEQQRQRDHRRGETAGETGQQEHRGGREPPDGEVRTHRELLSSFVACLEQ